MRLRSQVMMSLLRVHLKMKAPAGVALLRGYLDRMRFCLRWELVKIRRSSWKEYGRKSEMFICNQIICGLALAKVSQKFKQGTTRT